MFYVLVWNHCTNFRIDFQFHGNERATNMAKRHRTDKLTTKHSIIGDYRKVLLDIAELDAVDSIITGVISHNKTHHSGLTFQYMTETGIKLLAKTPQAVQEVFIVTKHRETLLDLLRGYGLIDQEQEETIPTDDEPDKSKGKQKSHGKHAQQRSSERTAQKNQTASQKEIQKHSNETTLSFSDYLSPELLQKLTAAKERLQDQPASQSKEGKGKQKQTIASNAKRGQTVADEEDISMEDLLNPKDNTESFSDLFKQSKLDWKKYK